MVASQPGFGGQHGPDYPVPEMTVFLFAEITAFLFPVYIRRYVDDGRFQIDNNLIENCIRPVALGRKNYMFAGSHQGARNAAVIYSLLATCKLRGVEPFEWLTNTLTVIPDYPANQVHKLLPGE